MSQKNVSDNGSDWCSDTTRRRLILFRLINSILDVLSGPILKGTNKIQNRCKMLGPILINQLIIVFIIEKSYVHLILRFIVLIDCFQYHYDYTHNLSILISD